MRQPFALASLAFAALALVTPTTAQAQESTVVTFKASAATLPKLLKALSEKTGETLECGSEYKNVAMVLSVTNVPLQELLDKIAATTLGQWSKTPKGHRLTADREAWKKLDAEAFTQRQAGFTEAVKTYVEAHQKDSKWNAQRTAELVKDEQKSIENLLANIRKNNPNFDTSNVTINKGSTRASTPASPALLDIVSKFPIATLAQIGPGQRVVFSSNPTRMQRPLPFNSTTALSLFTEAHNLLASAVQSGPPRPGNVKVNGGLDLGAHPLGPGPIKMLVILNRGNEDDGLGIQIRFADSTGAIVGQGGAYLRPKSTDSSETPELKLASDKAIDYSPVSLELANAFVNSQGSNNGNQNRIAMRSNDSMLMLSSDSPTPAPPLTASAIGALVDPADTDPQSLFVSEALLATAEAEKKNLITVLPDSVILPLARECIKATKTSGILQTLSGLKLNVDLGESWISVVPIDRLKGSASQMDRDAASQLFIPVLKRGYARLFELSKFASSLGSRPTTSNFGYTALRLLDPFVAENVQLGLMEQPFLYQFLATLDPSTFEGLRPEFAVGLSTLSNNQRALLERVAYGSDGMGTILGDGDFIGISISDNPNEPQPKGPSLLDEPTEVMPNGLPVTGRVTLRFKPHDMVKGIVTGQRGGQFFTAGDLGGHQAFQDKQMPADASFKLVAFDGFLEAKGNLVEIETQFLPNRARSYNYTDAWLLPGATSRKFDDLAPGFRAAVAKAREEMSRSNFQIGDQKPPPQN